eukprot:CAMPEP_0197522584 /NCGR_PEP_ID=MMETSP1318-20131121/7703_1 /TAXON_ID=552666 /ORGANISM="Partenskyella glossopodia, Strain RCC365" /LENGTH=198 /DNA_ID=CAMNT_0043074999 /DNA_START=45 /DNA_END=641 /DNA_ORIENTATION=+
MDWKALIFGDIAPKQEDDFTMSDAKVLSEDAGHTPKSERSSICSSWTEVDMPVFSDVDDKIAEVGVAEQQQAEAVQNELKTAKAEVTRLQGELKAALGRLSSAEESRDQAIETVRRLTVQNNRMSSRIRTLELRQHVWNGAVATYPIKRKDLIRKLRAKKREGGKTMLTKSGRSTKHDRKGTMMTARRPRVAKAGRKC